MQDSNIQKQNTVSLFNMFWIFRIFKFVELPTFRIWIYNWSFTAVLADYLNLNRHPPSGFTYIQLNESPWYLAISLEFECPLDMHSILWDLDSKMQIRTSLLETDRITLWKDEFSRLKRRDGAENSRWWYKMAVVRFL